MLYKIAERVIELEKQGRKIIRFNVGDPDQRTSPEIIKASLEAMQKGETRYGSSGGEKLLREKIAQLYNKEPENIVITPGAKWAIFSVMNLLLEKGENIVLPAPYWTSYKLIAERIGLEVKILKTDLDSGWNFGVEQVEELIDKNTRMIVLVNPHNPTSKVLDVELVQKIVDLANENKITILSDETYADISFKKVKSISDFEGEHVCVNSFSKTFAMTGWRLGFAVVPEELAKKMVRLNQITITCAPPFIQEAGIKALELKDNISGKIKEIYQERADLACQILFQSKLNFQKPDAPFYIFPECPCDSEKLAFDLLDEGVAVTPGTAFGDYRNYFRIALTCPVDEIRQGLGKIVSKFN